MLVGLPSTGVHSNGFSLVRKIVVDNSLAYSDVLPETGRRTLGEMLLTPTRIYVKPVLRLLKEVDVHGLAHITGGGFDENIPRILKEGQGVEIEEGSWEILPVFRFLEKYGKVPHREMFNIFNMGIGMVMAVAPEDVDKTLSLLRAEGESPVVIGRVTEGKGVKINSNK